MNLDTFITIFLDAFAHRMLPLFNETTLHAMHSFMPQHYPFYALVAGAGALAASAVLYAVGLWLRRMPARISTPEQQLRIEHIRLVANEWLVWLLILAPSPVGGLLIISAGFFALDRRKAFAMVLVAELAWRLSPLL